VAQEEAERASAAAASSAVPTSSAWFAAHEFRLAWRDWLAMTTGGKRVRGIVLFLVLGVFYAGLHLLAFALMRRWLAAGAPLDKETLVTVTGTGFLFWTVMLSQALESVTRAYDARSDLDLILSSPAASSRLFAVRTANIGLGTMLLACLLASPAINVLILLQGPHWLAAYGVLAALGALSAAISVLVCIGLSRARRAQAHPADRADRRRYRRRRLRHRHTGRRRPLLRLDGPDAGLPRAGTRLAAAPRLDSWVWVATRAAMGNPLDLLIVVLVCGLAFTAVAAMQFAASRVTPSRPGSRQSIVEQRPSRAFAGGSQRQALRIKEWKLLARDPWLLSQTLMQILYLVPPALFLWVSYGQSAGTYVVIIPVIVMAAGQLAGGLSWLAISGEDAHDLVVTAPISPRTVLQVAKVEAVLTVIAILLHRSLRGSASPPGSLP